MFIILALALGGSLAKSRVHAASVATLPTFGPTFASFLLGVILIVGGLSYFAPLVLGPIVEHLGG